MSKVAKRGRGRPPRTTPVKVIRVSMPLKQDLAVTSAAKRAGLSRSQWARDALAAWCDARQGEGEGEAQEAPAQRPWSPRTPLYGEIMSQQRSMRMDASLVERVEALAGGRSVAEVAREAFKLAAAK